MASALYDVYDHRTDHPEKDRETAALQSSPLPRARPPPTHSVDRWLESGKMAVKQRNLYRRALSKFGSFPPRPFPLSLGRRGGGGPSFGKHSILPPERHTFRHPDAFTFCPTRSHFFSHSVRNSTPFPATEVRFVERR